MNPKLKLLALILMSSTMMFFTNFLFIGVTAFTLVTLLFVFGVHRRFIPWIKPLTLAFVIIVLLQSLTFNGTFLSIGGFYYGILFSLRIFALVTLIFLFVETTPASRLAEAFDFLPESISQVLVLALALMPSVTNLTENIINAQKSRAMSFRTLNVFRTYFPVLVPLFAKMLYRSEHMSLAMQARGYGD